MKALTGRSVAAVVVAATLLLSGCSSDSAEESSSATTSTGATTTGSGEPGGSTDGTDAPDGTDGSGGGTAAPGDGTDGTDGTESTDGTEGSEGTGGSEGSGTDGGDGGGSGAGGSDGSGTEGGDGSGTDGAGGGDGSTGGGSGPTSEPFSMECADLTAVAVSRWVNGPPFDTASDITVDASQGDSSCLFSHSAATYSVLIERTGLETYQSGDLADLPMEEALTAAAEGLTATANDANITETIIRDNPARVVTSTTFAGTANAMALVIVDGALVSVTVEGDELSAQHGGLTGAVQRVMENVLQL